MRFRIEIVRRASIADPEGAAVLRALLDLGYGEVGSVRFGKSVEVEMDGDDEATARARLEEMCRRLLANPVMEDFDITQVDG